MIGLTALVLLTSCQAFMPTSLQISRNLFSSSTEGSEFVANAGIITDDSTGEIQIDMDKLAQESANAASVAKQLDIPTPKVRSAPRQSQWFPLLLSPTHLDGSMAGDVGFDPLNLGSGRIVWMRDAEVKHARLAMLAAAGWPLSELWHKQIASAIGLDSILAAEDKAPSVLNGGLTNEWVYAVVAVTLAIGAALEFKAMEASSKDGYKPGDYGFDPIGLYAFRGTFGLDRVAEKLTIEQKNINARKDMELAEIKNGRLAMLAITGMCLQEFISGIPVVQQTPFFFGDPIF
jgi:hypothetical protein